MRDLSASVTVFLIAIPLSLGLAIAVGAPLQAGLVGAAVGGIVAGLIGGSPLQVSGPSAGLTVVTAGLIETYGWPTTCAITVLAGLLQLALGALRWARTALAVSPAIVHGTLAGIGITIALAQLHVVLGGQPEGDAVTNLLALPGQLADPHFAAGGVGVLTVGVLLLWPRLPGRLGRRAARVPAALVAVVCATGVAAVAMPEVRRVHLPSWGSHVLPGLPEGPVSGLAAGVLTVTLVAGLESLLAAVAVDKLAAERPGPPAPRTDLDKELRGQGIANAVSGALGGLPLSGGAVRGSANVRAGARSRAATVLHGVWVVLAALFLAGALERIPLAALGALVMVVGIQMVSFAHIRNVHRNREFPVYAVTVGAVVLAGVLEGVLLGGAVAVATALHRLARTRITHGEPGCGAEGTGRDEGAAHGVEHRLCVRGQLTFLAVPRLSRALAQVPEGARAVVELDGSFMDHAAYETLQEWRDTHTAKGGEVEITDRGGRPVAEPSASHRCTPWLPWRNHQCTRPHAADASPHTADPSEAKSAADAHGTAGTGAGQGACTGTYTGAAGTGAVTGTGAAATASAAAPTTAPRRGQLLGGVRNFQRITAPLVRDELARLAAEGQQPSQLFLTCADSRLVTSMITSSGPGDLFTVRNVGNLVPLPGEESGDESVAAAIEYAVDVLRVGSVTVCGHSGCGAMQALHSTASADEPGNRGEEPEEGDSPLRRWLRHGRPSLERLGRQGHGHPGFADRDVADPLEALCLSNVLQQLEHLGLHDCVARRLRDGSLELHGMYFDVARAQAYVLDLPGHGGAPEGPDGRPLFVPVHPDVRAPV
ncbi:SulP family inorganic anion transporter [Streptomyces sp. ODS28]|uniref:SulP family inorganic anion transporter n=1 Tax=Streptomyces sp. ODS28 TaxID=3136688 RepID=UPI0031E8DBD9